jgi:hypothetical protein
MLGFESNLMTIFLTEIKKKKRRMWYREGGRGLQ